jgi:hypothetical protein
MIKDVLMEALPQVREPRFEMDHPGFVIVEPPVFGVEPHRVESTTNARKMDVLVSEYEIDLKKLENHRKGEN